MTADARRSWILFFPAAIFAAAIFGPVLFAPAGYAPATHDSDFYMYYFPMTEMAFEMMRSGAVPLWNPYIFSGMPLLASIEIGVLYPPNWVHLVLPAARAFCVCTCCWPPPECGSMRADGGEASALRSFPRWPLPRPLLRFCISTWG